MHPNFSLSFVAASIGAVLLTFSPVAAQAPQKPAAAAPAPKGDAPRTIVASEPTVTTALYGAWTLRCVQMPPVPAEDGKTARAAAPTCEIVQSIQVQGQAQPVAQIALGRLPNDKDLTLTALLPANIAIPGAAQISGNGKSGAEAKGMLTLVWQRCVSGACFATTNPDAETLAVFRKEEAGQLRFVDASGKMIGIPVSWAGLEQALDALSKKS